MDVSLQKNNDMKRKLMVLFMSAFTLSGCVSAHFHSCEKEVLKPGGVSFVPSSRFEDWSYAADTVLMKNVILQSISKDIVKRCFSHIVVDSILHSLGNPKSTVIFRRNSMIEYEKTKGLYFVDIPKLKNIRDFFSPTEYYYYIEVPVLFVNDSCWFINNNNQKMDSTLLSGIRKQLLSEFDSAYVETMIKRYDEGAIGRNVYYNNVHYIMK